MKSFITAAFASAATLAFVSAAHAAPLDIGLKVGAEIPAYSALDETGARQDLRALKGEKGAVIFFTRSADWCPYCQKQMIAMEANRAAIEQRGYKLVAITTDSTEKLAKFDAKRAIGYPMLSDPTSKLIDAFGIRDPAFKDNQRFAGLPLPTVYIVDTNNAIRAKFNDESYKVRPAPEVVISALDEMDAPR